MNFSEVTRRTAACRLCALITAQPNVMFVVHELHRRGVGGQPLLFRVRGVFEEIGEPVPSQAAFETHFTTHCTFEVHKPGDDRDYETDYGELRALYLEFRTIFQDMRRGDESLGDGAGAGVDLKLLVKYASELRQMLRALADMRNSEKLFSVVLLRHTEQLVHYLTEPLGVTLREVRNQLLRGDAPADVAAHIDALLGGEIFPLFEFAAQQALEKSRAEYKLH